MDGIVKVVCVHGFMAVILVPLFTFCFGVAFSIYSVCGSVTGWMSTISWLILLFEGVLLISVSYIGCLHTSDESSEHSVFKVDLWLKLYRRQNESAP